MFPIANQQNSYGHQNWTKKYIFVRNNMEVKINQPATKIAVIVKARTQISATKPELKEKKKNL